MLANAFWTGYLTIYGDGDDSFYPFVTLDTVAHEVAHGFTEQNSGLIYSSQSGGMNEAFSDITGATAEAYMKEVDWLDGQGLMKYDEDLRYFEDPSKDGHSRGSMNEYCPGIDVHYSSGLYNRAFYLLSNTPGWNLRKSFQTFAVANQMYWTRDSTFNTGACGMIQAAQDLGFEQEDVRNAFEAVGINPCGHAKDGVHALHNIRMIANETVQFLFNLENEESDMLRFEFHIHWSRPSGVLKMSVDTPTRSIYIEGSHEALHVMDPEPGQYLLTLEALINIVSVDVCVIANSIVFFDDFGVQPGHQKSNGSFYIPEHLVEAAQPMGLLPDTQNCGCACAGNAGNAFPVTAGQRSRHASRHVRHTRAVMHAGIAN